MLFVDDDENFRKVTAYALRQSGFEITTAINGKEALEILAGRSFDAILTDLTMPVLDGMALLGELQKNGNEIPVIVITAYGSIESAVEAMRAGAFDYVTKPVNREALRMALERALSHRRLQRENRELRERVTAGRAVDRLVGQSPAMTGLRESLSRLAESDVTVLLRGESGTGKELAARALHFDGPRESTGRFVIINCAAVPRDLLESELFGHVKGAYTSAIADRPGKFEAADGGTLFLDEIGDMPLELQAKLLRALQEGEIERIGENTTRKVNVRIVAATNQPLEEKVANKTFRQDLFYRLAVVPIFIPPLRSRLEDISLLVNTFLARYGSPGAQLTPEALEALKTHPWPGNVRELENVVQRACAMHPGLRILEHQMIILDSSPDYPAISLLNNHGPSILPEEGINIEEIEDNLLRAAWEQSGHNQAAGARLLGLSRQAFIYRLQKRGILPPYPSKSAQKEPLT